MFSGRLASSRPAESAAILPASAPIYSADQVAERMNQEGWVVRRVAELTREGLCRNICRFCHYITHGDLLDHIHDYDGETHHEYWTVTQYDQICDQLEVNAEEQEEAIPNSLPSILNVEQHLFDEFEEPQNAEDTDEETDEDSDNDETEDNMLQNKFGLRHRCPFNSLQSFSCTPGRNHSTGSVWNHQNSILKR